MGGKDSLIDQHPAEITIARWSDRIIAWIIDFAIVSTGIGFAYWVIYSTTFFIESYWHALTSVAFFAYWVILESKDGQSFGKKIMNLKTTNMVGQKAELKSIIVSSFGKSFLLPLDLVLGWIFTNKKKQRIFNRLSDTVVIKFPNFENEHEINYTLD